MFGVVYGGRDAGAFAAAAGDVEVAAGVLAVTGAGEDCADEVGVAAGAVALAGLEPLFVADAPVPDVAFSALAATAADLADGAAALPFEVVADDDALALGLAAGMAVAYALDGIADHATLALPSAHATYSTARLALSRVVRDMRTRRVRVECSAFTTGLSTVRYAAEAACPVPPARYTQGSIRTSRSEQRRSRLPPMPTYAAPKPDS